MFDWALLAFRNSLNETRLSRNGQLLYLRNSIAAAGKNAKTRIEIRNVTVEHSAGRLAAEHCAAVRSDRGGQDGDGARPRQGPICIK